MKVVHKSKKIFNGTYKGYFTGCVVSVEGVASFFLLRMKVKRKSRWTTFFVSRFSVCSNVHFHLKKEQVRWVNIHFRLSYQFVNCLINIIKSKRVTMQCATCV